MLIKFHMKKEIIYFLIFIAFTVILNLLEILLKEEGKIYDLCDALGQISLFIFYCCEEKLSKTHYTKKEIYYQQSIKSKENSKMIIIILLICDIIFLLIEIHLNYYTNIYSSYNNDIIVIFCVDMFFFKNEINSHHILSIIIISFICLLKIIYNLNNLIYLFIYLLNSYSYSFSVSLMNYINKKYFINIYLLGSLLGLFTFFYEIIYIILKNDYNFKMSHNYILYFICYIYFIIFYYFLYYCVFKFGSFFSLVCYSLFFSILEDGYNGNLNLILSGVNLFFCFVYLEVIELNFWGINQNLKVNIGKREIDEENTLIDEKQE